MVFVYVHLLRLLDIITLFVSSHSPNELLEFYLRLHSCILPDCAIATTIPIFPSPLRVAVKFLLIIFVPHRISSLLLRPFSLLSLPIIIIVPRFSPLSVRSCLLLPIPSHCTFYNGSRFSSCVACVSLLSPAVSQKPVFRLSNRIN